MTTATITYTDDQTLPFRDPLEAGEVPVRDLCTVRWVDQHLKHVMLRLAELIGPAAVAAQRHRPWWR
jgi:hypothetical protein